MKRNILSNIKLFYFYQFFRESVFWLPIITLFWQSNGLNLTQIMLLQSIYAICIVMLEIPTGAIADKVGRKTSLILSAIFGIVGFSIYGFGTGFLTFMIAEIILAFANTFLSGADSAFIYDSLKEAKKEDSFKSVRGNVKSLAYLAAGVSAIIGGLVAAKYDMRLTFFMSVGALILMLIFSLRFIEPKIKAKSEVSYQKHVFESFRQIFKNKQLLFLVLFHGLVSLFARTNLWFYQPYMKESGIPLIYFGIIWASLNLFAIAGSKSASRLESFLGEKKALWFIVLLISLSTIFISQIFMFLGIIFIFMQQFNRGFVVPVVENYTHKHLESHNRATLISIQGMIGSLFFAVVAPFFGWVADTFSLNNGILVTGLCALVAFSALMFWKSRIDISSKKGL